MTSRVRLNMEAEARHWVVRLSENDKDDAQAFEKWLGQNEGHGQAYKDAKRVWQGAGALENLKGMVSLDDLDRFSMELATAQTSRPKRYIYGAVAAAMLLFMVGLFGDWGQGPVAVSGGSYETAMAEIRTVTLSDGSVVSLGAASDIRVDFAEGVRRVFLERGQAFFDIKKDAGRPFYVYADQAIIRVVGTRFDVRRGAGEISVGVVEGIVDVTQGSGQPAHAKTRLIAGDQLVVKQGQESAVKPVSVSTLGAWREGRLYYEDVTLREVIADISRYHPDQIRLASSDIGDLRITGSFNTRKIDQIFSHLEQVLPVEVRRMGQNDILLVARD